MNKETSRADVLRALDVATQICVAKVANSNAVLNRDSGENAADFLEAIFKRVIEIESTGASGE